MIDLFYFCVDQMFFLYDYACFFVVGERGLEPPCSCEHPSPFNLMVPKVGFEPTTFAGHGSEPCAYANSATPANQYIESNI